MRLEEMNAKRRESRTEKMARIAVWICFLVLCVLMLIAALVLIYSALMRFMNF